jgi:hypothetical protein
MRFLQCRQMNDNIVSAALGRREKHLFMGYMISGKFPALTLHF